MAAAALVGGAAISAYSSIKAGEDKQQAYEMEAAGKRAQAAQVEIGTDYEIRQTQLRLDRTQGAAMAAIGKSGVTLSGTPLTLLEDSASRATDQMTAMRNAGNYRQYAMNQEAGVSNYLGAEASRAGTLNAFGSILGAAGRYGAASGSSNSYSGSTSSGGSSAPSMRGGYSGPDTGSSYGSFA